MPSASEFNAVPASNTTIGGVNVAEGCSPGGLNDAVRYIAAVVRTIYDAVPNVSGLMPVAGGSFTGDIVRQGRGAYMHQAGSGQTSGQVYFLPTGTALPTAAEGVTVFFYT